MGADHSADDRQPQSGPALPPVAPAGGVEEIEDPPPLGLGDPGSAVADVEHQRVVHAPGVDLHRCARGRELGGVLQDVEESLLDQRGVDEEGREVRCKADRDLERREEPAQPRHGRVEDLLEADPVALEPQGTRAQPGHVEEVLDVAIESLAFAADRVDQIPAIGRRQRVAVRRQAGRGADHRGERRAQIVGDGRQQGGPQPFGLPLDPRSFEVGDQAGALGGLSDLVDDRLGESALLGCERRLSGREPDLERSQSSAFHHHRQAPVRRFARERCGVHLRLVSAGRVHDDRIAAEIGGKDGAAGLKDLGGVGGHRQALAERLQRTRMLVGCAQGEELRVLATGELADDQRRDEESRDGEEILSPVDAKAEPRLGEEEVVGEEPEERCENRDRRAGADRDQQDSAQEHEGETADGESAVESPRNEGRGTGDGQCEGHLHGRACEEPERGAPPGAVALQRIRLGFRGRHEVRPVLRLESYFFVPGSRALTHHRPRRCIRSRPACRAPGPDSEAGGRTFLRPASCGSGGGTAGGARTGARSRGRGAPRSG